MGASYKVDKTQLHTATAGDAPAATWATIGSKLNTAGHDQLCLYVDYTNDGEDGVQIALLYGPMYGDTAEYKEIDVSPSGGVQTIYQKIYELTATNKVRIPVPIADGSVQVYQQKKGGTVGASAKLKIFAVRRLVSKSR